MFGTHTVQTGVAVGSDQSLFKQWKMAVNKANRKQKVKKQCDSPEENYVESTDGMFHQRITLLIY